MNVKDSFTSTQTYQSGAIYVNKRIENNKSNKNSIKDYWSNFNNAPFNWTHISSSSHQTAMESNQVEETVATNISNYELKNIDDCVVRSAINRVDFFYFSNLKKYFPHLKSISEFIGDTKFLKDIKWQVTHSGVFAPSWQEQRNMVIDVLLKIKAEILKNSYDYEGSKDFCPIPIKSRIINRQLKVDSSRVGMAQLQPPFPLNLTPDTKRYRQIDEENAKADEDEKDETAVYCPSESYRPAYSAVGRMFDVYSVFEFGKHYFAYVGYNNKDKNHMYLSLTKKGFALSKIADFPLPYVPFSGSLGNTDHSESVKIGALSVGYEKYDYLINEGKLYRYMGAYEDGILFKYARFEGNFNVDFIEIPYQLINEARQIVCRK